MQKIKKIRFGNSRHLHLLGISAWVLFFFLVNHHTVLATSSTSTTTSNPTSVIQGYNASTSIQEGMVVQLDKNNSGTVEPASQSSILRTFGVVINLGSASIAVENNNKNSNQVFVANSGRYDILVSDQNGYINAGDYITISSVDGIGMKDNTSEPIVVAQALSSFNASSTIIGTDSVKTSNGSENVHLGLISADVAIGHNPLLIAQSSAVPKFLASFSQSIAGKSVNAWRIWLGVAIIAVVAFIVGSMLYSAVRSSLISIGRNPLSKKAISRGFLEVVLASLIIFISAVFGVYLLLKA